LAGLDRSAVHPWALPKSPGGSGGLVPAKHHRRRLAQASAEGVTLSAADLVGTPSTIFRRRRPTHAEGWEAPEGGLQQGWRAPCAEPPAQPLQAHQSRSTGNGKSPHTFCRSGAIQNAMTNPNGGTLRAGSTLIARMA
jgi:hypothetical protein